eukprot:gene7181-8561_t
MIKVRFMVPNTGQEVKLVGSDPSFGKWVAESAPVLTPTPEGFRYVEFSLPSNERFEYKYVMGETWEGGDNRVLHIPPTDALLGVPLDVYNDLGNSSVAQSVFVPQDVVEGYTTGGACKLHELNIAQQLPLVRAYTMWEQAGQPDGADFGPAAEAEIRTQLASGVTEAEDQASYTSSGDFLATEGRWLGQEVSFMRSNDHKRNREGATWNTDGLS